MEILMKTRAPIHRHTRKPPLPGDAVERRIPREEMLRAGDDPGLTIVSAEQFDALLALLDDPPTVSDELRREVANRRWV
ncbi:hypothetical protein [Methylobacterium sp. 17Sr1-1]|uniref:hypothetical protein n=1 Tax=Methylobacterium sp. 17Sr1-1 TaxID=2202826 RepID=UPI001951F293|nr:hypothetical protein [Methylobacterium sp. 17Sr1-1]